MGIRKRIRRIKLGLLGITRSLSSYYKKKPAPYLPYDLNDTLDKYFNYNKGVFIEVGANDGYAQSNTYKLEKYRKWNGLLIEAIPELYEKCKKERRKSKVFNCALVSNEYNAATVKMHFASLMSVVDGVFNSEEKQKEFIQSGIDVQKLDNTYEVEIPARTLTSILNELNWSKEIDFFSLDVEGYEVNVLKGLDLSVYTPMYIMVETWDLEEVKKVLQSHYKLLEKVTVHDYMFKRI